MSGPGYIAIEPAGKCELCGANAETRPYGPNGERICFDCGMKDEPGTMVRASKYLFNEDITREQAEIRVNAMRKEQPK